MDCRTPRNILVAIVLCCTAVDATAQAGFEAPTPCARGSRIESNVPCEARPGRTAVIEHEMELTIRTQGITVVNTACQAEVSLSYTQNDTYARVDGEIDNATCAASSGSLVVSIRTANESGAQTTQEFPRSWMREDDQPVTFSAEYPIGENVELVRVRALRIRCACAEPPQAP